MKKIVEIIEGRVENMVNELIDNLSGRDYYDDLLDEIKKEGIDIEGSGFEVPSSFLIEEEYVKELTEHLTNCFSQRFYFSKEDCGEE